MRTAKYYPLRFAPSLSGIGCLRVFQKGMEDGLDNFVSNNAC